MSIMYYQVAYRRKKRNEYIHHTYFIIEKKIEQSSQLRSKTVKENERMKWNGISAVNIGRSVIFGIHVGHSFTIRDDAADILTFLALVFVPRHAGTR